MKTYITVTKYFFRTTWRKETGLFGFTWNLKWSLKQGLAVFAGGYHSAVPAVARGVIRGCKPVDLLKVVVIYF